MAYTKVFAIRKRLNKSIQYVQNSEKTELAAMIQYAENEEKEALVSALNCQIETAYNEMQLTKERWQKTDGVQGYHLIQSFAPGEVKPKEAHAIGVELANILFGEHYEVLIGTHLDQWHLHNHIVVNSVSFTTGEKYHSNRKSYYGEIRKVSDELCKKYALSVINPQNHGKHYAEYQAEKKQKPTIRSMIRMDIDSVINDAYSFQSFLSLLEKRGYAVNQNPKRKYITVKPPGAKRALRLASLGDGYTEEEIQKRIRENRFESLDKQTKKKYYAKHPLSYKRKKLHGFQALYFRYVYLLRGSKTKAHKKYLSYDIRKEVIRLERYQKQFLFLLKMDIKTEKYSMIEQLDGIDILMLRELQKDAKLTTKELAAKVNLSPSPVFERQKRLEREGYIKKYVAVVDPIKAGNGIMVLCNVRLKHHNKEYSRQFTSVISEIDQVVECFNTSGDYDYQLKIYARNMQDYQEFVLGTLGDLDCIGSLHSIFVIGEVKNTLSVPVR